MEDGPDRDLAESSKGSISCFKRFVEPEARTEKKIGRGSGVARVMRDISPDGEVRRDSSTRRESGA